jgi:hypothetical protein
MATSAAVYGVANVKGYKMMKISKIFNGEDISSLLYNLQSITIPSTNFGALTFNIISTYNYSNYFLYYISVVALSTTATFNAGPSVILSPGVSGFIGNDYDVFYGTVSTPQFSNYIMAPEYGWKGGISTPSNFSLIINGLADRAPIQDSNYASPSWSNVRYDGSRISSFDFNKAAPLNSQKSRTVNGGGGGNTGVGTIASPPITVPEAGPSEL